MALICDSVVIVCRTCDL